MIYCDDCRIAQDWPGSRFFVAGKCDVCGTESARCHGAPAGALILMAAGYMLAGRYVPYGPLRPRGRAAATEAAPKARERARARPDAAGKRARAPAPKPPVKLPGTPKRTRINASAVCVPAPFSLGAFR